MRRKCPKCESEDLAEILYGLPVFNARLENDLANGKVVLGGCEDDTKRWHCNKCKTEF